MRLSLVILAAAFSFVSAAIQGDIAVDSELGRKLLSQARRLDGEDVERRVANNNNNNNENVATWLAGFSLKFQGCFSIQQWNDNGDQQNEVRIQTKHLARFRLCPSSSCSATKAAGCNSGYGDYVVDMDFFTYEIYYSELAKNKYICATQLATCGCADGDESCYDTCFTNAGLTQCPQYVQDTTFGVVNYLECAQYKFENNNNGNAYYVGPYCASQGGSIHLGLFTDNTCTTAPDSTYGLETWASLAAGVELPYNSTSLASTSCLECVKDSNVNEEDNADQQSNNNVLDACNQVYQKSGKCESNLPSGTTDSPNDAGCNYVQGIKIARADGVITTSGHRPNPVVTAFIVIFAMAFAAMGFYVWYLRTRLGVKKNRLL